MSAEPPQVPGLEDGFTQLAAAWLYTHRSWNTRAAYEADLAWFAAWCARAGRDPLAVTGSDVEEYRADCEASGATSSVVRRRLAALTSFFRYIAHHGDAPNPAAGVERPAAPTANPAVELSTAEAHAISTAAARLGPKAAVLVSLLLNDGLKLGEVLAADVGDLSAPPVTVTVTRQRRQQAVPLHDATLDLLAAYLGVRNTGPLLLGPDRSTTATRLTRFGADYLVKRVTTTAGVSKPVSANTLHRHHVRTSHHAGESVDELQARLGHYDRRSIQRLLSEPSERSQP